MKHRIRILIMAVMICIFVAGCGSPNTQNGGQTPPSSASSSSSPSEPTAAPAPTEPVKQFKAVYTGEAVDETSYKNVPFLAVIENMKIARPQSGLSQADIVFETLAEGGIPRFMALFQSKRPSEIGPIRSDRVYFNELAKSLDLPFAHCGGSQASIDQISAQKLMSMNQFYNGAYYWRSRSRKAPHNLYTSSEKLEKLIAKQNYGRTPSFNLEFDNSFWDGYGQKADKVSMKLSGYYSTEYQYKNGFYYKTMNNKVVNDKNNGEPLKTKNIIVQTTRIRPIANDPKKRVEIGLTGSGTGYAFSNGRYTKIKWSKADSSAKIEITDMSGNAIKLGVGNTWWEIVDNSCKITIGDAKKKQ